jgi:histidyl-tRNA synthetase
MTKKIKPQTLKGFRDFLPDEMRVRNFVLDTIRSVFEQFGFEPLETPSLEYASTLLGKYGEEADRLVYTFKDRGDREVGLIYDLTVPVSRVLATYRNEFPLPFKRYQIQRVWRAEKPQKGRFREFVQCDFDIFGVDSPLADAEIVAVIYKVLKKLGFDNFLIRLNSRPLLFSVLEERGITEKNQQLEVLRAIDKLDKIPEEKLIEELVEKGLVYSNSGRLLSKLSSISPDENIRRILNYLRAMGLEEKYYRFDPTLIRGLDYYTGPIFEAVVGDSKNSVAGGGRYDNLIEQLGGPSIPATGASLGLDRICELVKEKNLARNDLKPATQVLVTIFDESLVDESLKLTTILQSMDINTEIYPELGAKLEKQIKYADRKGIPYVAILGPDEVRNGTVTVKDMSGVKQESIKREKIASKFQAPGTEFQTISKL